MSNQNKYYITQNELASLFDITPQAAATHIKKESIQTFKTGNKTSLSSNSTRQFMESRGYSYKSQVLAFQMLKGGSTKTSSAYNLAVRLNNYGARVLVIDLDMQGNMTDAFGVEITDESVFYHIATNEASIEETIIPISDGLDLIPSDFENSVIENLIVNSRKNLQTFIKNEIDKVRDNYDYIIIDCNPALSALNISIALACDTLLIPVNPDKFSEKGLKVVLSEIERIAEDYKKKIKFKLLFTLYDGREAISQKYLIKYGSEYEDHLISSLIRRNADVKNAIDQKKSIFDFKRAPAREDFDLFAQEILGIRNISESEIRR